MFKNWFAPYYPVQKKCVGECACHHKPASNKPISFPDIFKIVIILDESGSMQPVRQKMIDSLNDLIKEQKQEKGKVTTFTFVKFNGAVRRIHTNIMLESVPKFTQSDYDPNGSTALYDAIGQTIDAFKNEENVLMVIVTDGQENASTGYSKRDITRMINEKKANPEKKWSFVYLSCDESTLLQGEGIGITLDQYTTNQCMRQDTFGSYLSNNVSNAIKEYRTYGKSIQSNLNHAGQYVG